LNARNLRPCIPGKAVLNNGSAIIITGDFHTLRTEKKAQEDEEAQAEKAKEEDEAQEEIGA